MLTTGLTYNQYIKILVCLKGGFQTGGREGIIQGMWPVQGVESITSLLALMKIQAYE